MSLGCWLGFPRYYYYQFDVRLLAKDEVLVEEYRDINKLKDIVTSIYEEYMRKSKQRDIEFNPDNDYEVGSYDDNFMIKNAENRHIRFDEYECDKVVDFSVKMTPNAYAFCTMKLISTICACKISYDESTGNFHNDDKTFCIESYYLDTKPITIKKVRERERVLTPTPYVNETYKCNYTINVTVHRYFDYKSYKRGEFMPEDNLVYKLPLSQFASAYYEILDKYQIPKKYISIYENIIYSLLGQAFTKPYRECKDAVADEDLPVQPMDITIIFKPHLSYECDVQKASIRDDIMDDIKDYLDTVSTEIKQIRKKQKQREERKRRYY